jgi:alcohol dehydrogenase class IV
LRSREQRVWSLEQMLAEDLPAAVVWATPSVRARSESKVPYTHQAPLSGLEAGTRTLVVVGGGTLMDAAKVFRHEHAPSVSLVAIPSIWGSGAEASPVALETGADGRKVIRLGPEYVPDVRVKWPELADSVPPRLARHACGDAWSHALEGLLSPLAGEELRAGIGKVLSTMRDLPIGTDPRWFEASAEACRLQAQSSVGLVHGIAHTLEGPLRAAQPDFGWGHAALCSTFLWPVFSLSRSTSERARERLASVGIEADRVSDVARGLFEEEAYDRALPLLTAHWKDVLRDPCTRTNGTLVRPSQLEHFQSRAFLA